MPHLAQIRSPELEGQQRSSSLLAKGQGLKLPRKLNQGLNTKSLPRVFSLKHLDELVSPRCQQDRRPRRKVGPLSQSARLTQESLVLSEEGEGLQMT